MPPLSYTSFYRKYRPSSWDEVLGQDHIVRSLVGALQSGVVAHAYLFEGSRGTGKTSVARIFATALGVGKDDLYEIDGASNRGVDDIRALRESVHTMPFSSQYKCYIVDEAHMLTREAFNALLKTLEEPPSHVIFILATTEVSRLPQTVVSRCQIHSFRKPSDTVLRQGMIDISLREGKELSPSAATLITFLGDGSFRDAQGALQKVLSAVPGKKVTDRDAEEILGIPGASQIIEVMLAIAKQDIAQALKIVDQASEAHSDMLLFIKILIRNLRFALLLRFVKSKEPYIQESVSEKEFHAIEKLSGQEGASINSETLRILLDAQEQIPRASIPSLPLELALIHLLGGERACLEK